MGRLGPERPALLCRRVPHGLQPGSPVLALPSGPFGLVCRPRHPALPPRLGLLPAAATGQVCHSAHGRVPLQFAHPGLREGAGGKRCCMHDSEALQMVSSRNHKGAMPVMGRWWPATRRKGSSTETIARRTSPCRSRKGWRQWRLVGHFWTWESLPSNR